jgi:ATP-dependent Clp endopeptidase proteolytic subunit ClpP
VAKPLHITIYDQIGDSLYSPDGITAKSIQEQLSLNPEASEIILHINSPGGSVYEGYTIYNILKSSGKKVTAKVEGICASIATLIALSAEEIEMLPLSQWLIHNPFTYIEGDAEDLTAAAAELLRIEETLVGVYIAKTGKTAAEIKTLMKEDRMISADEAVEMGFVNRVAEQLKAVAYFQPIKTNNPTNVMTNEEQNSFADKIINGIAGLFKAKNEATPVAVSEPLEDGTSIYFEGELTEGTALYSDEEMTVSLADGDYTLADGRMVTCTDGMAAAIVTPEPENNAELEAAQARISELENQLLTIQNSATAKEATIKNLQAQLRSKQQPKPAQNFNNSEIKISLEKAAFSSLKRK